LRAGRQDRIGRAAGIDAQQQRDQPAHDHRIRVGFVDDAPVLATRIEPDLRLAARHAVLRNAFFRRDVGQLPAELDDVLVALQPRVEQRELVDDLLLLVLDGGKV